MPIGQVIEESQPGKRGPYRAVIEDAKAGRYVLERVQWPAVHTRLCQCSQVIHFEVTEPYTHPH